MEKKALVFNLQRYSIHDGPGIRTLIFFKGCPMRCEWCSNPESQSGENQIKFVKTACNSCGACVQTCPSGAARWSELVGVIQDVKTCVQCGACIEVCTTKSRSWWGTEFTVDELFKAAMRDKSFFKSTGGGLTLGGGDPLMQYSFVHKFLLKCKENGVNTAIETEAFCDFNDLASCASLCDTVFIDLKAWKPRIYRELIGVEGDIVLDNLSALNEWMDAQESNPSWIIRIPFLPEENFFWDDMEPLADYLLSLWNVSAVEILPFHNLGEHKYAQTGMPYKYLGLPNLKQEDVQQYAEILRRKGVAVEIKEM